MSWLLAREPVAGDDKLAERVGQLVPEAGRPDGVEPVGEEWVQLGPVGKLMAETVEHQVTEHMTELAEKESELEAETFMRQMTQLSRLQRPR